MIKKIQCKDHGEQEAALVDSMLCRYKCKECINTEDLTYQQCGKHGKIWALGCMTCALVLDNKEKRQ